MDQAFNQARQDIETIDAALIQLLIERFLHIETIKNYKQEHHLPIYCPQREQHLLDELHQQLNNNPAKPYITAIYQELLTQSKNFQKHFDQ